MTAINFLHFSDFHQGMETGGRLWPSVSDSFYQDLTDLSKLIGEPWDLVFFTGDLTQRGAPEEYAALDATLEKIWKFLEKLGSSPLLLPVPGNHDLQRPAATSPLTRAFANWNNDPIIQEEFWKSNGNEYISFINHTFSAYTNWLRSNSHIPKNLNIGILPGDYSYRYSKEDIQIGVIGLNSSFLHLSDSVTEGSLDLDVRQLTAVCSDPHEWSSQQHASFLLTHHPHSWLSSNAKHRYLADILARDRFIAHFFGHMHRPNAEFTRTAGGHTRRWVQGPSLLGLEKFGHSEQVSRIHGYTAGRLKFADNTIKLSQWPRIATLKRAGYYKFSVNVDFDTEADGSYNDTITQSRIGHTATLSLEQDILLNNTESARFLDAYRRRLSNSFDRWDLQPIGVAQSGGATRPVTAQLDQMYVPLRFAVGYDVGETNRGQYLSPEKLLATKKSIIVRGPAGAGKTTWLRHAFRKMLSSADVLPIMIVLRDLARRWISPSCVGEARSIEAVLQCIFEENVPGSSSKILSSLLESDRPQVVLLVDGWDEVGPLAEELRAKLLGFLRHHPRTFAIVTSRPYGESQPTSQEGFTVLDLQPLSSSDIATLATHFFKHCYGDEAEPVEVRKQKFVASLHRSPESLRLARTPLLLTMMLFISRSRPLPDKRHKLYHECVENLLTALPDAKVEDGALQSRRHWRPDDGEERLRTTASLAAALFRKEQQRAGHKTIVASIDELEELLPAGWPEERHVGFSLRLMRVGFIYWLAASAGLLSERSDGTFVFTHLSFQEYLTAWHMNATVEGETRIGVFSEYMLQVKWREVLRLWAAIIGGQSETRVSAVIDAIGPRADEGLILAGLMFADGLGTTDSFNLWKDLFIENLQEHPPRGALEMLLSWTASRQETRKAILASSLEKLVAGTVTAKWLVYALFASPLTAKLHPPPNSVAFDILSCMVRDAQYTQRQLGVGRIFAIFDPLWPGTDSQITLLNLWPSRRRFIGYKMQVAAAFGATRSELQALFVSLIKDREPTPDISELITERVLRSEELLRSVTEPSILSHFAAAFKALSGALSWLGAFDSGNNKSRAMAIRFIDQLAAYLHPADAYVSISDSAVAIPRSIRFILGAVYSNSDSYVDSFCISSGLALSRTVAARTGLQGGHGRLLEEACRVSMDPERSTHSFETLISDYPASEDPLWLALAKHITRRSDSQDRQLLNRLAANPEEREDRILLGLKYFVRGDIILSDGSEITLDDITTELGLPALEYLDELPEEIRGSGVQAAGSEAKLATDNSDEQVSADSLAFDTEEIEELFDDDSALSDEAGLSEDERLRRLNRQRLERSVVRAISWYEEGRFKDASKIFLEAFQDGVPGAGNNLCFTLRRGELGGLGDVPSADVLLNADASSEHAGFVCVNRALCFASGFQCTVNWRTADELIGRIRASRKLSSQLSQIQDWWGDSANRGDAEGDLVIGWLVRHGYIDDPDGCTLAERMAKARAAGWAVPAWMDQLWTGW